VTSRPSSLGDWGLGAQTARRRLHKFAHQHSVPKRKETPTLKGKRRGHELASEQGHPGGLLSAGGGASHGMKIRGLRSRFPQWKSPGQRGPGLSQQNPLGSHAGVTRSLIPIQPRVPVYAWRRYTCYAGHATPIVLHAKFPA